MPIRYHERNASYAQISLADFGKQVLQATEGVLLSLEDYGRARHNAGFRIRARHPVVASVIFATGAPDDEAKFRIINALIEELDPGFPEDKRLLEGITRRKSLVGTLASPHMRRAVYDRLAHVLPGNGYVLQHRSILEKELGDADAAIDYARRAISIDRQNAAFQNTLGLALEFAARSANPLRRDALLSEASGIFDGCIRKSRFDAFAYLGRVAILRQRVDRETSVEKRRLLQADMLAVLEEGFEATDEAAPLAGELARQRKSLGSPEEAIKILAEALQKKPSDERLRNLLVQMEMDRGNNEDALRLALAGEKLDPTAWRIQRYIARLRGCQTTG